MAALHRAIPRDTRPRETSQVWGFTIWDGSSLSGGPQGYVELLVAVADPDHPDHEELTEWIGGSFDSSTFDLEAANRALARAFG